MSIPNGGERHTLIKLYMKIKKNKRSDEKFGWLMAARAPSRL